MVQNERRNSKKGKEKTDAEELDTEEWRIEEESTIYGVYKSIWQTFVLVNEYS